MGADRYDPTQPGGVPAPKMPSAADVARIPEPVQAHALVMLQLGAATRSARMRWYAYRDRFKSWLVEHGGADGSDAYLLAVGGPKELAAETHALWAAELAQEVGAAVYREQLAENNARPTGERWSPTVLALWAPCSIAGQKPA